jgi:hypothetical protein
MLRQYPFNRYKQYKEGGNLFSTSISVLASALQKIARCSNIKEGTLLYRGLGGKMEMPDSFFKPDENGCRGFAEWGFMSTTSDKSIAIQYSGVKEGRPTAMILVLRTNATDRGASIQEFSQYPGVSTIKVLLFLDVNSEIFCFAGDRVYTPSSHIHTARRRRVYRSHKRRARANDSRPRQHQSAGRDNRDSLE